MSLSDIVGRLGLSFFPAVAMVIFVAIFIGAMLWIFAPSRREELRRAAVLPLDDDQVDPSTRHSRDATAPR